MVGIVVIITVALIAIGVAGYLISTKQMAHQRRKARIKLLQQVVRNRFESSPEYKGDRHAFHHAVEQIPAVFGSSGSVVAAFHRYRDTEVSGSDQALVQHHLTELLREMCRDVDIDVTAVREELPLTSARSAMH
jgi:hypothetical protein